MLFDSDPMCPGWAPRVHTDMCPATPEEDAGLTAGFTPRLAAAAVNSRINHFCKFQYLTEDGICYTTDSERPMAIDTTRLD